MENEKKIDELERRVDELRKEAYELKALILEMKRESVPKQTQTVVEQVKVNEEKRVEQSIKQREQIDWEKKIGQVWLPRIFIFVLLLGIIWAFKAASDYGFMQPPLKVAVGFIAAGLLFFLGQKQLSKNRNALGQVLLGGSVVLLLIDTFAAHVLYDMFSSIFAFILNIIWISLGIYLAHRYKSEPLAILTGIGGYLIPFLLETRDPNIVNFVVFETIFYLTMLIFALKKKFTYLYTVSFLLLHVTLLAAVMFSGASDERIFGVAVMIQHVLLLVTFFIKRLFIKKQITVLFTSFLLTAAWVGLTFSEGYYELIILFSFILYCFVSAYLWKTDKERLVAAVSISTVALLLFLLSKFEVENIQGLVMIQGLISIYLGMKIKSKLNFIIGATIYIVSALFIFSMMFHSILSVEFVNWVILLVSAWVIVKFISMTDVIKESDKETYKVIILTVFLILLLIFTTLLANALTTHFSVNIQYMTVSFSWAVYALISIFLGVSRSNKVLRVFGLILLFITLGKLLFVDLVTTSILVRAILFIGLGIIGVFGSRIFYTKKGK